MNFQTRFRSCVAYERFIFRFIRFFIRSREDRSMVRVVRSSYYERPISRFEFRDFLGLFRRYLSNDGLSTRACEDLIHRLYSNVKNRSGCGVTTIHFPSFIVHRCNVIRSLRRSVRCVEVHFFCFIGRWRAIKDFTSDVYRRSTIFVACVSNE